MKKILFGIAAVGFLSSCQQVAGWFGNDNKTDSTTLISESANKAKMLRDESITKENAYSDLFIDTAALENYIRTAKMEDGSADRMREFYTVRNNQFAWFTSQGMTEQARGLWGLYASEEKKDKADPAARIAERMDSLITNDSLFLTTIEGGHSPANQRAGSPVKKDSAATAQKAASPAKTKTTTAGAKKDTMLVAQRDSAEAATKDSVALATSRQSFYSASDTTLVNTELALTAQYVHMAMENNGVITADNFFWLVPRKRMDAMEWADSLLNKQKDSSLWQGNQQYAALRNSLQHYYKTAKNGGWPRIGSMLGLRKGVHSPAVVQLKKRLAASGDYVAGDTSNVYTDSLAMAIMTVQQQFGLAPTGQINDSLVQELNVPAEQRVQQILVNMNRALWLPPVTDSSHISVNIPAQELVVYGDSGKVMTMPVIVGKEGSGTMAFADKITTVVFSPYWNLPQSIVQNEIKPAMQKDPAYLKKRNMEIVKQEGDYLQIRQLPGKDNALGRVKFLFPNSFDIYLHDTPNKDLFAQQNRALSHGCIRVAKPDSLAAFVLRGQQEWTAEKITAAMNGSQEQTVKVAKPIPVAITYYTAWAGHNGKVYFRKDLYGFDQQTAARMFTNTATSAIARL